MALCSVAGSPNACRKKSTDVNRKSQSDTCQSVTRAEVGRLVPEDREALCDPVPEVTDLLGEPEQDDDQHDQDEPDDLQERDRVVDDPAEVE